MFGEMDAPLDVFHEGASLFKYGITDDMRQTRREALLKTNVDDIVRVAEAYLTKPRVAVVVGDETRRAEYDNEWTVRIFEQMGKDIN